MPYVPFKFPPGMARPGTVYEAKGRWYTGTLVRWFNGVLQEWGGWSLMTHSGGGLAVGEPVRGMYAWRRNTGSPLLAFGTPTKLWVFGTSTLSDETPGGFTTGGADAAQTSGAFGTGAFGAGAFGMGDEAQDVLTETNWWQFDNYHEDLVAWAYSDRKIYLYDTSAGTVAALTNAPTNCAGVVVTPENFVVALGPAGVPRRIKGADVDDPTLWTPDDDNFAFELDLRSAGRIITGRATSRETLIWTDVDLHALRYVGGEFIYGLQQIGRCSLISGRAMGIFDDKAFWMGKRGFYIYDGEVRSVPSEVADYVFTDLNYTQASKIHAVTQSEFHEIVIFYPSGASTECDRYVAYNWLGGFMYTGNLQRTAGVDSGIYPYPIMADAGGAVYRHEIPGGDTEAFATAVDLTVAEYPLAEEAENGFALQPAGTVRAGQTFTLTSNTLVSSIKFRFPKVGSPTGDIVGSIYPCNNEAGVFLPSTDAVALVSSPAVDAATISTSPETVTFTFSSPVLLPPGNYAAVFDCSGMTGDDDNYILVRVDDDGGDVNGNPVHYSVVSNDWANDWGARDIPFVLTGRVLSTSLLPFAESGPYEVGLGDYVADITEYVPDEKTLGGVNIYLLGSYYPNAEETTYGPFAAANPTSLRVCARQVRLRIERAIKGWRFGVPRFGVKPGGLR